VGFLEGELGLGEVARKLGRALQLAGVPFAAIPYRRTPSRQQHPLDLELSQEAPFDTNIICLNADYLHAFLDDVGVDFFAGRYSIGVWFWESSVLQAESLSGFRFLDEIWVASEYVRRAVAEKADIPVHVVPLPVEAPPPPTRTRAEFGLPEGFVFLYVFDFVSAQRKNPLAVVEAFELAFPPGEGPALVMKSINGRERKPQLLAELVASVDGRPDIVIVDEYFSAEDKEALIASCDCYVSLHRSEGFGLTMAEAMAHGKPVIATGYSGNLEFMEGGNSYLVPYRLVPVPEEWWAHAPGAEWADPDVETASALMRAVYEDPNEARARGKRGRDAILSTLSLERSAAVAVERLSAMRGRGRELGARSSNGDARSAILRASTELEKGVGMSLTSAGRHPRLVRRLLLRALWPYLEEQHRVNTMSVEALTALQRSIDELGAQFRDSERAAVGVRDELAADVAWLSRPLVMHLARRARTAPPMFLPPDTRDERQRDAVDRVLAAYERAHADEAGRVRPASMWEVIEARQRPFIDALELADEDAVGEALASMMRSDLVWGISAGLPDQAQALLEKPGDNVVQHAVTDMVVSFAEAVGDARVACYQLGAPLDRDDLDVDLEALLTGIEARGGVNLEFPHVGSAFGCRIAGKLVNSDSVRHAYTLYALRRLGAGPTSTVAEIGGGSGCFAAFCHRAGIEDVSVYDVPWVNALQGYFLVMALPPGSVRLYGEAEGSVAVEPYWRFDDLGPGSVDFVVNTNSLPEVGLEAAYAYVRRIGEVVRRSFLSINHESRRSVASFGPQACVRELVDEIGTLTPVSRTRTWLWEGYVEEVFAPIGDGGGVGGTE
jgi:glycosyltransferase involved in cell wall biosynthesis